MEGKKFLKVEGVSKSFDAKPVLEGINFTVKEDESFGILGKSGSGKTALMNLLRGIREYKPTKGTVLYTVAMCPNENCGWVEVPSYAGKKCERCGSILELEEIDFWSVQGTPKFKNLYNRLSMMLQRTFALYTEKTVIGNLEEALKDINYPKDKTMGKIMELMNRVKLVHRSLHVARDLSGGEKQRVVLARQFARNPIVLFADEPTGTLDPITAEVVHEVLKQEVERGLTLIMTSHWLDALVDVTNQGIVLEKGHIIAEGPTKEIEKTMAGGLEDFARPVIEGGNVKIRVENCKKYFYTADRGAIKAVDGVGFEVSEGEIFAIMGVSGAGKTTLGKILAGLQDPSTGKAYIRIGDDWIDMSVPGVTGRGRATPYISILHQEYGLYPYSTVLQNLTESIGLAMPMEIAKEKAMTILKAVGFSEDKIIEMLDTYPDDLSEGERHRVALARALMTEPEILILDEPTGTIDSITQNDVAKAILSSRKELNQSFIIMSHDPTFIEKVCDKVMLMSGGKIIETGEPKEVVNMFKEKEKPMGT